MTGNNKFKKYSFAVGSRYGLRSCQWSIAANQDDIYINSASFGPDAHISLHKSGQWHMKAKPSHHAKQFKKIASSHVSAVPHGKYPVGLYIIIPDASLRQYKDPDRSSNPEGWLPRPPYGGAVEIAVIKWDWRGRTEEWPGQAAGTWPFWAYTVKDAVICLMYRAVPSTHPVAKDAHELISHHLSTLQPTKEKRKNDAGMLYQIHPYGALYLTEYKVGIQRSRVEGFV